MARSVPWRRTCNDLVFWRQTEAQNATIYILRETGPTGFLLKTEGEAKPCKAFLGDPHSCTCTQFMKDRDLCKHICWLLLKKFRVPQTNAMSWQKGLVEREINEILRGLTEQMRKKVPTAVARWRRPLSSDSDAREQIAQREIKDDDVCPICQDELLAKRLPVTYCKFGCGNSIHIKCMKIWAEHQKSQGETTVKCPFCREDFGPFELLKYENRNAEGVPQGGRMDRHLGVSCQSCHVSPIEGKCYRCSRCNDFNLCQTCFNTPIHTQHAFQYRHKRNQRWRAAGRAYGAVLPQAVMDDLVNREISDNDYDLLMQLDSNTQGPVGSDIPEEVVQSFPLEKVRENGPLLQPGMQCRVCLRGYQVGQFIRKLPRCKHKFHRDCIDNWLIHSRPTCPVDGQVVWDPITAQLDDDAQTRARQKKKSNNSSNHDQPTSTVNLEIPGVGLTIRNQDAPQSHPQGQPVVRGRPPLRRPRDRADREAERVLGALQGNFSVSGTSVGNNSNMLDDNHNYTAMTGTLPGARLLHRTTNQQTLLNQRLAELEREGGEHDDEFMGISSSRIGEENQDPLDQVIAANQDQDEEPSDHSPQPFVHNRQPNHSSLFASDVPSTHNSTAALLTNMERITEYETMPNIFEEAIHHHGNSSQALIIESARTAETGVSLENSNSVSMATASVGDSRSRAMADIPPEQRLFSNVEGSQQHSGISHTNPRVMFNPVVQNSLASRGGNTQLTSLQGRQLQNTISSAPASIDGDRGRRSDRGARQGRGSQRYRSTSRDRGRDTSLDRARQGSIPKEGENLIERLTMFSDLYLGNNPRSHAPVSGVITTATGLPPRPQRRQYGNAAAARQRRFENERRRNNFGLEGNGIQDMTLRDLLS